MLRRVLLVAVIAALVPFGTMLAPVAASAATSPACTGTVDITQFAFNPTTVAPGQLSTVSLTAQNCTNQAVQGNIIWSAKFTWPGTGIPPGCPAIDPIGLQYSIPAGGTFTPTAPQKYGDTFDNCQATGLQATVSMNENGVAGNIAQATANLSITQPVPPGGCHVTYTPNVWPGGFTASVTIENTSPNPVNWSLTFTFPGDEQITNSWSANVSQSGENVTATGPIWAVSIPPGGSQSFGFQGTWATSDAAPTSFAINGITCT